MRVVVVVVVDAVGFVFGVRARARIGQMSKSIACPVRGMCETRADAAAAAAAIDCLASLVRHTTPQGPARTSQLGARLRRLPACQQASKRTSICTHNDCRPATTTTTTTTVNMSLERACAEAAKRERACPYVCVHVCVRSLPSSIFITERVDIDAG